MEADPSPSSEHFGDAGGAHVSCFVDTDDEVAARSYARRHTEADGWVVRAIADCRPCERSEFTDNAVALGYFDEARQFGGSLVIHSWPAEPQDKDNVH